MSRNNQANAVKGPGEMNPETDGMNLQSNMDESEPGFQPPNAMNGQTDWPSYGRQDHLKILKLVDKNS